MGFLDDLTNLADTAVEGKKPPSTKVVDWFHQRVSTSRPTDLHHTLGKGSVDASPGDHAHNGKDSRGLFDASTIPADMPATPTTAQIRDTLNYILAEFRKMSE